MQFVNMNTEKYEKQWDDIYYPQKVGDIGT